MRLGKVNAKYDINKRIVRITYASVSENQNINDNLKHLKDTSFSSLHFSDDYNNAQRDEFTTFKSMTKLDNESNTKTGKK